MADGQAEYLAVVTGPAPERDRWPGSPDPYGPYGWTADLVVELWPWLLGDPLDDLCYFAGAPASVVRGICAALGERNIRGRGDVTQSGWAQLIELCGADVTFCGFTVDPERPDERIEFTAAQLDVTGWAAERVDDLRNRLAVEGWCSYEERHSDGLRVTFRSHQGHTGR